LPAKHANLTCLKPSFNTEHALDCRPASVVLKVYPRQNLWRYEIGASETDIMHCCNSMTNAGECLV